MEWMDCCGYVNAPLSAAVPLPCWSEGVLVKNTKQYVVLASSQYRNEGEDPTGDYIAIPKGTVAKIKRL